MSGEGENLVRGASIFYGALVILSLVWGAIAGIPVLWIEEPPTAFELVQQTAIGIGAGLLIVLLSRITLRFGWGRDLVDSFHDILGPITAADAVFLALVSATGEEMLFRGAMHPTLGLLPTAILFGLAHWPHKKSWIPWTLSTLALGFLFGWAVDHFGQIIAPFWAHFVVNALNLRMIRREKPE